ncbi:A24 family peptidase [Terriglobus roseus]|uniref:Prepilin peptidase CpaA n=1 Tax=Terriglobus roseus TaxID=392734 RepID=A0A1H4Q347_9BACT|nr:A24 family peptidase [Terriglobus roseus]SEC13832.1 prepilin peptidase CpaA [Terriglobus roseus]
MISIEKDLTYAAAANIVALTAAVWDVATRRIPNLLVLAGLTAGLVLHLVYDGWHGLFSALLAGFVAGAIFFIFYSAGGMGGGDVKLMAAVATLYGFASMPYLLVLTSLAGGVLALAFALRHHRLKETLFNVGTLAAHHAHEGLTPHDTHHVRNKSSLRLPYGVAIAAGCLLVAAGRG